MRILVVRLSALGDLVHTIPVVAALRRSLPDAQIDWLVADRFRELVELVPVVDRVVALPRSGMPAWRMCRELRRHRYDVAIDVQGLLKSALAARLVQPKRVIGFSSTDLREPAARWLHTESVVVPPNSHVIAKNLTLVSHLLGGAELSTPEFPIEVDAARHGDVRRHLGLGEGESFVLMNPGAAWPSKCWDPARYGLLAERLLATYGLRSAVSWGPGDESRARTVLEVAAGAAVLLPLTGISDLAAYLQAASAVVAGDTGPLHLAAALGTPVVGIYGSSDPERNGPWSGADCVVSRYAVCRCRMDRQRRGARGVVVKRCVQPSRCLDDIEVDEIAATVGRRLGR